MGEPDAGTTRVVVMPAEIDVTSAAQVDDELRAAAGGGARAVVADFGGTRFCDSAGINMLLQAGRWAGARGVEVRLAAVRPSVLRVLDVMGVNRLLQVYPDVPAALSGEALPGR